MDIKHEEVFKIKQEEVIIKEEYICVPEIRSTSTAANHVKTDLLNQQSESGEKILIKHSYGKPYECNRCSFKTAYPGCLKRHINKCETSDEQEYLCAHCPYTTKSKKNLPRHLLTHTGKKPHQCQQCDYKALHKQILKKHELVHVGEKLHHCQQCDFKTLRKDYLKQHLLLHAVEKPHNCEQCSYKTASKYHFKRHLLLHGDNIHHCKQCAYKTINKYNLNRHLLVHTNEKRLQCQLCAYKTLNKYHLKQHLKIHTGNEEVFQCAHCSYRSMNKNTLRSHVVCHIDKRHSQLKEVRSTNSYNEVMKDNVKFLMDPQINFVIKEEPNGLV